MGYATGMGSIYPITIPAGILRARASEVACGRDAVSARARTKCHPETKNPLRGIERGEELEMIWPSTRSVTVLSLVRNARS